MNEDDEMITAAKITDDIKKTQDDNKTSVEQPNTMQPPTKEKVKPKEWRTDAQLTNSFLLGAILSYKNKRLEDAIAHELVDLNAMKVPTIDGEESDAPPIIYAIREYNRYALTKLLEAGADVKVRDESNTLAISKAFAMGDCEMVQILSRFGAKLTYLNGRGTALHAVLRNVAGFSLLKTSSWLGDEQDAFGGNLFEWFEGEAPKPNIESLRGTYFGNTSLLSLVLQRHPEFVFNNENNQPQPIEIAKNPKLLVGIFHDANGNPIKCEAGEDGVLILKDFCIYNRNMSDSVLVKELRYDFS